MKETTLVYLLRDDEVLLAMKKRGFGVGKWNGPGGKVEPGETNVQGAMRECQEESGLLPKSLQFRGVITFFFENKDSWNNRCSIYTGREWEGTEQETEEMLPKWYKIAEMPYDDMWEDDRIWMPFMFAGQQVFYNMYFDENGKLLRYEALPVPEGV